MEEERSEPSPGALRDRVPGGGGAAHGRASEQRGAGAGGESGSRKDRGAAPGVGWPVWGPPLSSRCWEARWREGTEEGRKKGRVSRRAGTGRGSGLQRRGREREGKGRRDPRQTARSPRQAAAGGRGKPGAPRGWGWGWRRGPSDWGGGRGRDVAASSPARGRVSRARLVLGRSRVPSPVFEVVPDFPGGRASGGFSGATPLFPTFFRSFLGLARGCTAPEPTGRWGRAEK